MVSVRAVAEMLDKEVNWDGASKSVLISDKAEKVSEAVEDKKESKEGDSVGAVTPINKNDYTQGEYNGIISLTNKADLSKVYLRLDQVNEAVGKNGYSIEYASETKTFYINIFATGEQVTDIIHVSDLEQCVVLQSRTYVNLDLVKDFI